MSDLTALQEGPEGHQLATCSAVCTRDTAFTHTDGSRIAPLGHIPLLDCEPQVAKALSSESGRGHITDGAVGLNGVSLLRAALRNGLFESRTGRILGQSCSRPHPLPVSLSVTGLYLPWPFCTSPMMTLFPARDSAA